MQKQKHSINKFIIRISFSGCTKAFSQLSNLQSHSRCHQTDKPYKCNSCYKCFHDELSLLKHIPKHKESKHLNTHICSYCGKSYTQETYLTKHMQKHADRTDKRPPIVAEGTSNPSTPMGHLASPPDHYWPKMYGYGQADQGGQEQGFATDLILTLKAVVDTHQSLPQQGILLQHVAPAPMPQRDQPVARPWRAIRFLPSTTSTRRPPPGKPTLSLA